MDNKKEYILCAAYRQKKNTANRQNHIDKTGLDFADIYYEPHKQVFNMRLGWRHADILYQFGDEVDKTNGGGFMTSKGRYVDRKEAMKIALACGQVEEGKTIHGSDGLLFSEDLY